MTLLDDRTDGSPLIVPAPATAARLSALAQLVVAIVAILLLVGAVSVGTMASFTGSGDNATPVFSVGTLVLSNTVDGASACLSTSGPGGVATNDAECDGLFDLDIAEPGDGAAADVDLANVGSMDGELAVHGFGPCVDADSGAAHHGTGDLCDELLLSVQSYTSAENRTGGVTTGGSCVFGGGSAEACAFNNPAATVGQFLSDYPNFADTLAMGPMGNDGPTSTRYLRVSVLLPASAGNDVQGRSASFGLTWRLVQ